MKNHETPAETLQNLIDTIHEVLDELEMANQAKREAMAALQAEIDNNMARIRVLEDRQDNLTEILTELAG